MFNIAVVDVLLMLRVWALYNGSRRVMWFLIGVLVIGLPAAIAIRKVPPLPSIPLITPAPQSLTICKRSPPSELFSLFTMALAIETVIFSMVIIKAWGKQFRSSTPVLTVLIRDGALYYAAITGVLAFMIAATMIPILYQPVADANLNIPLCSLACNRLVLSLRGAYFRASGQGQTTLASYDITNRPNFAVNPNSTFNTKNQSRDIQLDSIHVTSPQTSTPLKRGDLDEYDWVPASARSPISPDRSSVENSSRATQRRPSLIRKGSTSTGDDPLHRRPSVVRWDPSHVKVTQTHTVHDDDGVDLTYDIPSPEVDTAHKEGFERTHGLDWWDTREKGYEEDSGVHGGGYDARRGRRTDRIEEDIEPSFDGPYTSHSGRAV
ncbi:hypothetical protein FRC19_008419 [Serendipita sp. 401]|nr:hypothetical protein FRC19_008419 [Serendipita sp. 401]KAG9058795.1 hypothetical protein FS842_003584 [Serendipita sp. 407]